MPPAKRHGFVRSSFFSGLDDVEYWHHCLGGREGLVDTAVKTAVVGYIQRKLCQGMKNNVVRQDGTVRNNVNQIISHRYGDDSFDGAYLVNVKLMSLHMTNDDIRRVFSFRMDDEFDADADADADADSDVNVNADSI
jgi:DNA-directed RNA polymerase beta' subunit